MPFKSQDWRYRGGDCGSGDEERKNRKARPQSHGGQYIRHRCNQTEGRRQKIQIQNREARNQIQTPPAQPI